MKKMTQWKLKIPELFEDATWEPPLAPLAEFALLYPSSKLEDKEECIDAGRKSK